MCGVIVDCDIKTGLARNISKLYFWSKFKK